MPVSARSGCTRSEVVGGTTGDVCACIRSKVSASFGVVSGESGSDFFDLPSSSGKSVVFCSGDGSSGSSFIRSSSTNGSTWYTLVIAGESSNGNADVIGSVGMGG